jgi:hypothetical protein
VECSEEPMPAGEPHIRAVEWSGRPTEKVFRQYVGWMNSVEQQLADKWGVKLMHVYTKGPEILESWCFVPNERPHKL